MRTAEQFVKWYAKNLTAKDSEIKSKSNELLQSEIRRLKLAMNKV